MIMLTKLFRVAKYSQGDLTGMFILSIWLLFTNSQAKRLGAAAHSLLCLLRVKYYFFLIKRYHLMAITIYKIAI